MCHKSKLMKADLMNKKTKLNNALLNEESGLRCFIFTGMNNKRFIFLDSDELDLLSYFEELIREEHNSLDNEKLKKQSITNHHQLKSYIKSMETEYNKNVVKSILSMLVTDRDLELIGVKPSIACVEQENAALAAEDMLKLRYNSKIKKIKDELSILERNTLLTTLSEKRQSDNETKKAALSEQIYSLEELVEHKTNYSQQKYKQAVNRSAQKLVKENRLKGRKLGAGVKPLLDSEDEEFVSNAIASKSTCHGRRTDATLYLHHRVKCEGLLALANYSFYKRGKN